MRLGEFLEIVRAMHQRIVIPLGHAGFEQMQQNLRVFGVVLILGVVEGISRSCHRERRKEAQLEAALAQIIRQGTMVIARGFESDEHWRLPGTEPVT
jgi:hypothetical protein